MIAAGAVVAALVVAVAVVLIAAGDDSPSGAERAKTSREAVAKALAGLELLQIEYAQAVEQGRVVEPTEYQAALADVRRSQQALDDVDADAGQRLADARSALVGVEAAVRRRIAVADLERAVQAARAAIQRAGAGAESAAPQG